MSTDYNYDENGQFFPFFILTMATIFTLPLSYSALKPSKALARTGTRIDSGFRTSSHDLIDRQRAQQRRRERKVKRMLLSALGWAVMGTMVYLIVNTSRSTPKIYDPYDILGVPRSADESAIKKHYRKLSITEHPDKRRPDASKNETVQDINDRWVDITKAFKTLTDEDIRNNYIQYGHPDGKQSFSIGIALPQFIVSEGNGKYVLLLYGFLLSVLLPLLVGRWWYGTQGKTRDGARVDSAGKLFSGYKDDMSENGLIENLSTGEEYQEDIPGEKNDGSAAQTIKRVEKVTKEESRELPRAAHKTLQEMTDKQRQRMLALLWAYLYRVDLQDAKLNEHKNEAATIASNLNESFQTITLAFGNLRPLLSSFHVSQNLVQAIPPGDSPLLQLPYFDKVLPALRADNANTARSLRYFFSLSEAKRRALTIGPGLLTQAQYDTAMTAAAQLPMPRVERAFFKVTGEKYVTTGSLMQFVIKVRFIPPTIAESDIPPVNPKDLEDPDPKEGDLDALHGRKKKKTKPGASPQAVDEADKVQPPLAHAPYFARDHSPRWHLFLADVRQGRIAVPPFNFSKLDSAIFHTDASTGQLTTRPTYNVQTLRMQFQAPPQHGSHHFAYFLMCDSYVGLDATDGITMVVEEMSKAESIEEEDEISEPEEDSLAGQMAALKGAVSNAEDGAKEKPSGEAKSRPRKAKVAEPESDDDSDSDVEGSEDSSESDTDTDTEDES